MTATEREDSSDGAAIPDPDPDLFGPHLDGRTLKEILPKIDISALPSAPPYSQMSGQATSGHAESARGLFGTGIDPRNLSESVAPLRETIRGIWTKAVVQASDARSNILTGQVESSTMEKVSLEAPDPGVEPAWPMPNFPDESPITELVKSKDQVLEGIGKLKRRMSAELGLESEGNSSSTDSQGSASGKSSFVITLKDGKQEGRVVLNFENMGHSSITELMGPVVESVTKGRATARYIAPILDNLATRGSTFVSIGVDQVQNNITIAGPSKTQLLAHLPMHHSKKPGERQTDSEQFSSAAVFQILREYERVKNNSADDPDDKNRQSLIRILENIISSILFGLCSGLFFGIGLSIVSMLTKRSKDRS